MAKRRKVVTLSQATQRSKYAKSKKRSVGFATGVFDVLHLGHTKFLESIKEKVDILIIGIDDNSTSKRIKGYDQPFFDETERAELLSKLEIVDYVFVFDGPCDVKLIAKINPTYYAVSPFDPVLDRKKKDAKDAGVKLFVSPDFLKSYSSSVVGRSFRYNYLVSKTQSLHKGSWKDSK